MIIENLGSSQLLLPPQSPPASDDTQTNVKQEEEDDHAEYDDGLVLCNCGCKPDHYTKDCVCIKKEEFKDEEEEDQSGGQTNTSTGDGVFSSHQPGPSRYQSVELRVDSISGEGEQELQSGTEQAMGELTGE